MRQHSSDIVLWRSTEQTPVFTIELGGAFIADDGAGGACGHMLIEHQLPGFLQAKQFLKLYRAHSCDDTEMLPKGGGTHIRGFGQLIQAHLFGKVLPDLVRRLRNPIIAAAAMSFSSVSVIANALRLRTVQL